jgi:deoxyribonuclease V
MKSAIEQRWDVSPQEARSIQHELASAVSLFDKVNPADIRTVGGVDNGYVNRDDQFVAFAAVVVMSFPAFEVIETAIGTAPVTFPYVPGLLTFREAPAILDALGKLNTDPDVLLFDGHGIAHPRRFGLAAHMGVVLDWPSIGCAKSKLTGQFQEPDETFGATSPLIDGDEIIGTVVRSHSGHSPLFVSPGHRVSTLSATEIALACCDGKTLMPRPTQAAHNAVAKATAPFRRKQSVERG